MGARPSLAPSQNSFIAPITDSDTWTVNELALAACIANADPNSLLAADGLLEDHLVQLMEATQ